MHKVIYTNIYGPSPSGEYFYGTSLTLHPHDHYASMDWLAAWEIGQELGGN